MPEGWEPAGGFDPLGEFNPRRQEELRTQARKRNMTRGFFAIATIAALAFSMLWNPPTASVHSFTRGSDYNAKKESGCTNSGKGCHDDESAYTDFNDYHPNATCTTCHEYQGVGCIPCHAPSERECPACHDGTMKQAGDRVRLSDPYPKGHYRESTHTVMGTDFDVPVRGAEGGAASATCGDCHDRDLATSHTKVKPVADSEYGDKIGCGECHNDTRTFGQARVLDDWKDRSCEACHRDGGSAPMHPAVSPEATATSGVGCADSGAGCHEGSALHPMHADAPEDCSSPAASGEPGCHDMDLEAHVPTATSCGGTGEVCHASDDPSGYEHERLDVHSPNNDFPAFVTSFYATRCGDCHRMAPDGSSLIDEHARATSVRSRTSDGCRNCHDDPASERAIVQNWPQRDSASACDACHGSDGLDGAHARGVEQVHDANGSDGCAASGPGCHIDANLSAVGEPTPLGGLHRDCLRCHDWRTRDGNLAYDPTSASCGSGRDCHGAPAEYSPATSVHAGGGSLVNGRDAKHTAGDEQRDAVYYEPVSGVATACKECHGMVLAAEHTRPNVAIATGDGPICGRCHNNRTATAANVKGSWPARESDRACAGCHGQPGVNGAHHAADKSHYATELGTDGRPSQGACSRTGCHQTTDVRRLHRDKGCANEGCHQVSGDIRGSRKSSCGGTDERVACHVGFSSTNHFQSHTADLTGTVNGVTYVPGANVGCFGCHYADLRAEHSEALKTGSMEGGGSSNCHVCHADPDDPGSGRFSTLPAVKAAIVAGDRRCVACHQSGNDIDGPVGTASPHKDISTATVLPAGKVWSDPFEDWKSAFESPSGGGHNVLASSTVGATVYKRFPETTFTVGANTYGWGVYNNLGVRQWIRESIFPTASVDTTQATLEAAQASMMSCTDCHYLPEDAVGPQGASVKVYITPGYAQTEYANPSPGTYQFDPLDKVADKGAPAGTSNLNPPGYKPVICFKCHTVFAGSMPGSDTAMGGASLHRTHRWRAYGVAPNRVFRGGNCVDCHVRIPHAWRRPRMLLRTLATTDGAPVDEYPLVRDGHDGLLAVKLKDYSDPTRVTRDNCVTGGCYSGSQVTTNHPSPAQAAGSEFWP